MMVSTPSWFMLRTPAFTKEWSSERAERSQHFGVIVGPVCTKRLSGGKASVHKSAHACAPKLTSCARHATQLGSSQAAESSLHRSDLEAVRDALCHGIWVM